MDNLPAVVFADQVTPGMVVAVPDSDPATHRLTVTGDRIYVTDIRIVAGSAHILGKTGDGSLVAYAFASARPLVVLEVPAAAEATESLTT
ncbi:hypothetical protein MXD62_19305 [Frankia sp. Mgl5]|uniref:hypothetical protein n=1 Tax=Frankia sp. Mgl5 TaxID=2933793 RepID=UPI00200C0253|nr:hypothetical protein [Frankia sp. Mgl5]MCK9929299.1 hypothetical protein [Frankia sp. Mgl5]